MDIRHSTSVLSLLYAANDRWWTKGLCITSRHVRAQWACSMVSSGSVLWVGWGEAVRVCVHGSRVLGVVARADMQKKHSHGCMKAELILIA